MTDRLLVVLLLLFWIVTLGVFEIMVETKSNGITCRVSLPSWPNELVKFIRRR